MKPSQHAGDYPARENKHTKRHTHRRQVKVNNETELFRTLEQTPQPFVLILDCLQDPHNLGAILRSAEGAGVSAVISPKDKSVDITETVRRISVGAADIVPYFRVNNLARTMSKLREMGLWLAGTSDQAQKSIYDIDFRGPVGIVLGAEGSGMRRLTEEGCDFLVKVPMAGKVECLNVSVAAGVCLYEVVRQRGTKTQK